MSPLIRLALLALAVPTLACIHKPERPDGGSSGDGPPASPVTISTLAAGDHHACAITQPDQRVLCWGANVDGQLGATPSAPGLPVEVIAAAGATHISAGRAHTCAIVPTRGVMCWGASNLGQTGPNAQQEPHQVDLSALPFDAADVFAGGDATCVIDDSGAAACWGDYDHQPAAHAPQIVTPGGQSGNWSAFALSSEQSCALKQHTGANDAFCWGADDLGQAGGSGSATLDTATALSSGSVAEIAVASGATFARTPEGLLVGWGDVRFTGTRNGGIRQLIDGTATWDRVAAGRHHGCGISAGNLHCFGSDDFGATGSFVPQALDPTRTISGADQIVAGAGFTCLRTSDHALCLGADQWGELGIGEVATAHTPVTVDLGPGLTAADPPQLAVGWGDSCVVVAGSPTHVMCWGDNRSNQISSALASVAVAPTDFGASDVSGIAVGARHVCAIQGSGGAVRCKGNQAAFSGVANLTTAIAIAAADDATCAVYGASPSIGTCTGAGSVASTGAHVGAGSYRPITIAMGTDQALAEDAAYTVDGWGTDCNGTTIPATSPVQPFQGASLVPLAAAQGTYASVGTACTLDAVDPATPKLQCFGPATHGAVPGAAACRLASQALTVSAPSSRQWLGGVLSLGVGGHHGCALDAMHHLACWGDNTDSSFGMAVPELDNLLPVGDDAGTFKAIAIGPHHGCAITQSTNEVQCWGLNRFGEVGTGAHAWATPVPVQLPP